MTIVGSRHECCSLEPSCTACHTVCNLLGDNYFAKSFKMSTLMCFKANVSLSMLPMLLTLTARLVSLSVPLSYACLSPCNLSVTPPSEKEQKRFCV